MTQLHAHTLNTRGRRRERASAVVYRIRKSRAEFLLVSRSSDPSEFVLPGGHIDPDESPQDAAKRECYEESGVEIEVLAPLTYYNHTRRKHGVKPTLVYLAMPVTEEPSPEGRDTRWVRIKDVTNGRCMAPDYVLGLLKQANDRIARPSRAA